MTVPSVAAETATLQPSTSAENVGIVGMQIYFPSTCVEQKDLEKFDGVSEGKYTIGLGQTKMGFCSDREDIQSMCLTVVDKLVKSQGISYNDIGRLEVGTETIIDKSKSVKTCLMQLFKESGNTDVEGIDSKNACYGGTAALFNSLAWVESSAWDGRYAVVVAGDIAVYASGNARPTGGAGVVAMLIGPNAPVVFEQGLRASHMEHVWDFYKPDLSSEYPVVDGPLSVMSYLRSLDICYKRYREKFAKRYGSEATPSLESFDYMAFHSPFTKLVQKSYARLLCNDFLQKPEIISDEGAEKYKDLRLEDTYGDKVLEKAFVGFAKPSFAAKVDPSLLCAKQLGNIYTGSVYGGLLSLLCQIPSETLNGKRIGLFSYGSGLASSLFSVRVTGSVDSVIKDVHLKDRLDARTIVNPSIFDKTMKLREETHSEKNYRPTGSMEELPEKAFYVDFIDDMYRRTYLRRDVPC